MKETKYRVYDSRGHYQQSYSGLLKDGFSYARDCAKRTSGYVVEILIEDGKETSSNIIFDVRGK